MTISAYFVDISLLFQRQICRKIGEKYINLTKTWHFLLQIYLIRGGFRVQKKVVTNFCKIDTIYITVIALIFVVIVVVIIIIAYVAILFCFEILVVTA